MRTAFLVGAVIIGLPGAMTAAHLALLAVASLAYREPVRTLDVRRVRFLIMIPAHNEEAVLEATLSAIDASKRAHDRVLVVADRCTDATAELARAHGAWVLERDETAERGRAAARHAGLQYALAHDPQWEFVVMIDADSVVAPDFFDACERRLRPGVEALQARSEAALDGGIVGQTTLAAYAILGVMCPRGRAVLGLPVRLRGTGAVLSRRLIETYRFRAPASEDRWFSMDLCVDGISPKHVEGARLRSENVTSWRAAAQQRTRYEAGRMTAAREFIGPLLRRRSKGALEAAWELATPPFAVAALLLLVSCGFALLGGSKSLALASGVALALLTLALIVALLESRASVRTWTALLIAPWYLLWKVTVQLRALRSVRHRQTYYPPTVRG